MSNPIRPRIRLSRAQYEKARADGYSDDEIRQEYDLPPDNTLARTATGVLGKAVQGISLGFADELAGGLLAPWGKGETLKEKYQYTRGLVNNLLDDADENAPVLSKAAEFGGMIAPALAGAGTLLPRAAGTGFRAMAARGAANVAEGAATAGVAAFGSANGTAAERMAAVPRAAVVGGVAGGALPAVAAPVMSGARRILGRLSQRGAARLADELTGRAIEASGRSADDLTAAVADASTGHTAGKPLTLMERMGTAGRKLARGAKTSSPGAAQTLDDLAEARMPGAGMRVGDDVREALGVQRTTPQRAASEYAAQRTAIGTREFTPERMAAPVNSQTAEETLLASPVYRDIFEEMRAAQRMRPTNGPQERTLDALFGPALDGAGNPTGAHTLTRPPTVRDIETIRQGLYDVLQRKQYTQVHPVTGRRVVTNLNREAEAALRDARAMLMEDAALNAQHPWYQQARTELESLHQAEQAISTGRGMHDRGALEVADQMAEMAPHEQVGARVGYAARLDNRLANAPPVAVSRVAGGGGGAEARAGIRERLMAVVPDNADVRARLTARLGAEDEIAATQRFLGNQSNTADKIAERESMGAAVLGKVLRPAEAFYDAAAHFFDPAISEATGRTADQVARYFATLDPLEQAAIIARAKAAAAREAKRRAGVQAAGRGAAAMGGAASGRTQR